VSAAISLGLASPSLVALVAERTSQALRTWTLRWGLDATASARVCAEQAWPVADGTGWHEVGAHPTRLLQSRDFESRLCERLFGELASPPPPASLAARSVQHLAGELRRLLAQAWHVEEWRADDGVDAPESSRVSLRWLGCVDVDIQVAGAGIRARVPSGRLRDPSAVASGAAPPDARRQAAFGSLALHGRVVVGRVQVSLADVAELQPGDVLVLDGRLQDASELVFDGGPDGLRAALGRLGTRRAVQCLSFDPRGFVVTPSSASVDIARPRDLELSELGDAAPAGAALLPARLSAFAGVKATVEVVAGKASTTVGELLGLKEGSVLALDRAVDAPFDVLLDGVLLARGQLVAVGEQFGVRIVDVCAPARP